MGSTCQTCFCKGDSLNFKIDESVVRKALEEGEGQIIISTLNDAKINSVKHFPKISSLPKDSIQSAPISSPTYQKDADKEFYEVCSKNDGEELDSQSFFEKESTLSRTGKNGKKAFIEEEEENTYLYTLEDSEKSQIFSCHEKTPALSESNVIPPSAPHVESVFPPIINSIHFIPTNNKKSPHSEAFLINNRIKTDSTATHTPNYSLSSESYSQTLQVSQFHSLQSNEKLKKLQNKNRKYNCQIHSEANSPARSSLKNHPKQKFISHKNVSSLIQMRKRLPAQKLEDGRIYEGQWVNGERNGFGIMKYRNGSSYTGQFKRNMANGQGCLTFQNGESYSGSWVNDKAQGHGTFTHKNAAYYTGIYLSIQYNIYILFIYSSKYSSQFCI